MVLRKMFSGGDEVLPTEATPLIVNSWKQRLLEIVNTFRQHKHQDNAFHLCTLLCALLIPITLLGILVTLSYGAFPAWKQFGVGFFSSTDWDPVHKLFGGAGAIYGTVITSLIALLIAVPTSFGIALFLSELAPPSIGRPLGTAIELLAAIPSIIYGMWGLFVLAPVMAEYVQPLLTQTIGQIPVIGRLFLGVPMGIGMLTSGIILAIMIIPFIASVMRDVFETVPRFLKESAYGMGATTWEVAWHITLTYCRIGVIGGIMLGLGRALGETMAVTFVIGNAHGLSLSLFKPGSTISSVLANEYTEAVGPLYNSALMLLGLILFVLTFFVIGASKILLRRVESKHGGLS